VLCWIAWVQGAAGGRIWYEGALASYVLALLSKESAVIVVPLLALVVWVERKDWRARLWRIVPFGVVAGGYFAMIYGARSGHLHFHDGTFSLHAPFWSVVPVTMAHLFWVWGLASLAALAAWRARQWLPLLGIATAWIVVTLLPYSFLTYMPRVPSRHTYLASAGLALIFAAGFLTFRERVRGRRWAVAGLAVAILAHQCVYLWTRKQHQYLVRAAPTEALLQLAREHDGPIRLGCFPYDRSVAEMTLKVNFTERELLSAGGSAAGSAVPGVRDLCSAMPAME